MGGWNKRGGEVGKNQELTIGGEQLFSTQEHGTLRKLIT